MASTIRSAVKAYLERHAGLGVQVHARRPPRNTAMPYVVVHGPIASPRDPNSAPYAEGATKRVISEMQLSVWQHEYGEPDSLGKRTEVEDPLLPDLVAAALDGAYFGTDINPAAPIYGSELIDGPRELEQPEAANQVHHIITVDVHRALVTARP